MIWSLVLPSIIPNYHMNALEQQIFKIPLRKAEQVVINQYDSDQNIQLALIDKVIVIPSIYKYNKESNDV
jgi:hypothetical protein